jgi:hypothetical protein
MSTPVIVEIGRIRVTSGSVVTPAGELPLRGSEWTVADQWVTERRRPTWAAVLAVVGFCVAPFVSLLFLRVRRTVSRVELLISVRNGPHRYAERVPAADQAEALALRHRVDYARSLAAL